MNFCQPRSASAQKVGQMQAYPTVACILSGFGIAVLMFRIQRELHMQERHPDSPKLLAWADYLVIGSIALSLLFVVLPLVALPSPGKQALAFAAASCAAATILLAGSSRHFGSLSNRDRNEAKGRPQQGRAHCLSRNYHPPIARADG